MGKTDGYVCQIYHVGMYKKYIGSETGYIRTLLMACHGVEEGAYNTIRGQLSSPAM